MTHAEMLLAAEFAPDPATFQTGLAQSVRDHLVVLEETERARTVAEPRRAEEVLRLEFRNEAKGIALKGKEEDERPDLLVGDLVGAVPGEVDVVHRRGDEQRVEVVPGHHLARTLV